MTGGQRFHGVSVILEIRDFAPIELDAKLPQFDVVHLNGFGHNRDRLFLEIHLTIFELVDQGDEFLVQIFLSGHLDLFCRCLECVQPILNLGMESSQLR